MGMFNHPIGSAGKPPAKKPMSKSPVAEHPEMENMEDGEQDGAAIAAEHGPAHEIHMQHEHEMGAHHVHSVHPDGHEHHSDHGSVKEAHDHAHKLAGGAGEGGEGYETAEEGGY